jgi:hypothetical protein
MKGRKRALVRKKSESTARRVWNCDNAYLHGPFPAYTHQSTRCAQGSAGLIGKSARSTQLASFGAIERLLRAQTTRCAGAGKVKTIGDGAGRAGRAIVLASDRRRKRKIVRNMK